MSAPIDTITPRLAPGYLTVVGAASIYGFTHSPNLTFGVIHEMSIVNTGAYSVGQSVLIPYDNNQVRSVTYSNQPYWLIQESQIILVEVEEVAP